MSQQLQLSTPPFIALRANIEQIAAATTKAAGAQGCYLVLSNSADQRNQIIIAYGDAGVDLQDTAEIAPILQRTFGQSQPSRVSTHGLPALLLPLCLDQRSIGIVLMIYRNELMIDEERANAAAVMASYALDSVRQIAELHLQAEEIEARARVREIQLSRNLIRGVIDSIPLGLALLSADGTVLAINRALSNRFGREPAAVVGRMYDTVIGSWQMSSAARTFSTGTAGRVRRTMIRPDGGQALLEISSFPLLDADERPRQVVEVWEDITERVALQTQLVRAEKLAAIGQLAASIAHEIGNPLQAIQGFLSLFLEDSAPETPNRSFLELAQEEIERIVRVLSRLRDLYRPRADVMAMVDVNELIDNVILLTSKQLERARIRVLLELASDLPAIKAVADELKQVLLNLVLNAADAMPRGGMLQIQTMLNVASDHSHSISIAVTDVGMGIAPEQLPHIFDGLHTTKERGMGLGLYTSKAIIERHMGRISVQSTLGEGTTFTIILPTRSEEVAL